MGMTLTKYLMINTTLKYVKKIIFLISVQYEWIYINITNE